MCHTTCVSVQEVRYRHNKMCVCLACQIHNKMYLYNTQTTKCMYLQDKVMHIQTCIQGSHTHACSTKHMSLQDKVMHIQTLYTGQSHTHECTTKCMFLWDKVMHIQTCIHIHIQDSHIHAPKNVSLSIRQVTYNKN